MFVITGATGHTGSVAAEALLEAGEEVRVVVRDAAKAGRLRARGAEVVVADLTDQVALQRAVRGARGVFFLSPPDLQARDFIAERKRLTEQQVRTLAAAEVPHVVFLSSLGAHRSAGTGVILSVHNVESQLRAAGLPSTFVRAGHFLENWGSVVPAVKADGVLPSFLAADRRIPTVSTTDVGRALAEALRQGPRGVRVIELGGPTELSPQEVADGFSRVLGKPVKVAEAPLHAVVPMFTSFGASENIAGLYREMYQGFAEGTVAAAPGEQWRGTTPLDTTLRTLAG
jgi:uncharacterized protein YbjT (DUF2867 family)